MFNTIGWYDKMFNSRGFYEIMQPLAHIKKEVEPYASFAIDSIKDAIPRPDPDKSYWYKGELPTLKGTVVTVADTFSTVHPNYLLVAATFVAAFFILYIKMQYPFWNQIPALHVYDWHRRFLYSEKPYVIHLVPKKTKYYESKLVSTCKFRDMRGEQQIELTKMLQNHYLPSDRVFCSIQLPDLVAQCADATVSVFNELEEDITVNLDIENTGEDSIQKTSRVRKIEGFVSSRRVNTHISLGTQKDRYIMQEPANYIDYLCFDKTYSSSQKIRKLFQTHEYNERMRVSGPNITLFKKEVELCDAIVPLVEYDSLTFYLRYKIEPAKLPGKFHIVRIQKEHLRHLHDWMERIAALQEDIGFRVSITMEIGDLIHLLQTNQMFAYVLRGPDPEVKTRNETVYAIYFFRNAHMKYEDLDGGDTLHSVAAFSNTNDFELYFLGFVWAVREARKDLTGTETKMIMIDDIGHLRGIAKLWMGNHNVVLRTKCAYYFCNYVVPRSPYKAEEVNMLI